MFTGIVQACLPLRNVQEKPGLTSFSIELAGPMLQGLKFGGSISIDGVCLTVTKIQGHDVFFDVMMETLNKTTLGNLEEGRMVNVERSAMVGDEIGGHNVSGHVTGVCKISGVEEPENNKIVTFECEKSFMKYILHKGYIALDGVSLTLVDPNPEDGTFKIFFIPETLDRTTFGFKNIGDSVNLEVDVMTRAIVDTVERVLEERK
ncbi:MAG: riboflavin synthase [Candidatus Magasanikbacteria bacterium CG11_big_fil_rev_8_21_14_0_20_39_34]|uniref:Riboflavin synthase n=1 Tax=Candidatus Magasanikbacteria bacterium CG11_big_fil_rev_8_21_14_0_20_39_34 TaxID=1974653 RepID=A0A2H0N6I2_9BACT|nr:MAG: riboflavin synthase [Candidatus Magasanikbacteria bacterium CG11_big_fil_rev_8_21_14_0_20_39_34]